MASERTGAAKQSRHSPIRVYVCQKCGSFGKGVTLRMTEYGYVCTRCGSN